jgi:hypothetical protein
VTLADSTVVDGAAPMFPKYIKRPSAPFQLSRSSGQPSSPCPGGLLSKPELLIAMRRTFHRILVACISFGVGLANSDGCTFTISSSGGLTCPAGQLSDGQIRLNGTEPTVYFTIKDGKITDAAGRGCIVTGADLFIYSRNEDMLIQR